MKTRSARKNRTASSNRWLCRHVNDHFVKAAKRDQYRSRAAYKLLEIQQKFSLIKRGMNILDLGVAPGGWAQVTSRILNGSGQIVGVDILNMNELEGLRFINSNIEDIYSDNSEISTVLSGMFFDVILSDLAPNASGSKVADSILLVSLCKTVLQYRKYIKSGGRMVMKMIRGSEDEYELIKDIRANSLYPKYFKPKSSRKESREIYLVISHNPTISFP